MKTKEEIKQLAENIYREFPNNPLDEPAWHYNKDIHCHKKRKAFINGYTQCQQDMADKKYTEEDMLNASKYGYEFRDTTSFPKHKFEDSCINNTKQWLEWYKNKQD